MHHLSLDESFWRSAAEALASGVALDEVDPSLVDVARLLQRIHDRHDRRPGSWLGFVSLEAGEPERTASLVLAALLSRGGGRTLLVDLHFGDDTWNRLLGVEELEGVVDHIAYGTPPGRLMQRTSWDSLSLLPAGTAALHPPAILRSDKLHTCLLAAARGHDLVCLGLPFEEGHVWGAGATAGLGTAVVIGPRGDELAYERAIPRLVPAIVVLATLDVPPPGRWRPALGAALPAVLPAMAGAAVGGATADAHSLAEEHGADPRATYAMDGDSRSFDPGTTSERPSASAEDSERSGDDLSLFDVGNADAELDADVAFLTGAPPSAGQRLPPRATARPLDDRAPGPATWGRRPMDDRDDEPVRRGDADLDSTREDEPVERRWAATVIAVLLCVALGAGAFWYWRANQQIPDGEFAVVETTGSPGAAEQAARVAPPTSAPDGDAAASTAAREAAAALDPAAEPSDAAAGDSDVEPPDGAAPAPETETSGTETPEPALEVPVGGAPLPFSLHVGSFQSYESAARAARDLERRGYTAFVAPVLLEGKGRWYRLFFDALPDGTSARAGLERAIAGGAVAEGTVRETPWALYLGSRATGEEATAEVERLGRSGISAYAVGDGPVRLYTGAFETAGDAELLNRELRDRGFEGLLVRRRAVEER